MKRGRERYNEILRKYREHYFDFWTQVQSFYYDILPHMRVLVDAAAGGPLSYKTLEEAWEKFEMMAHNDYQRQGEQAVVKKGYMEEETLDALLAYNKILTKQLTDLTKKVATLSINVVSYPPVVCDFCGGDHGSDDCPGNMFSNPQEQVNYMGNPPRPQNKIHTQMLTIRGGRITRIFPGVTKVNKGSKDHHFPIKVYHINLPVKAHPL